MAENELYMTTQEVAEALGISTSRVRQLLLAGELVANRIGDRYRGYWQIKPEQVEIFKMKRRGPGRPRKV